MAAPADISVDIRAFAPGDAPGIVAVVLPIQRDEFGFDLTVEDQPDLLDIQGFYQTGTGGFWVATAQGAIVGTIGLRDIGGGAAALRKMFVAAPWRGPQFAIAARLLSALLDHAREQGLATVWLGTTDRFLAAHRFYEKQDFREVAKAALPANFPFMAVDTKFYARDLNGAATPA